MLRQELKRVAETAGGSLEDAELEAKDRQVRALATYEQQLSEGLTSHGSRGFYSAGF